MLGSDPQRGLEEVEQIAAYAGQAVIRPFPGVDPDYDGLVSLMESCVFYLIIEEINKGSSLRMPKNCDQRRIDKIKDSAMLVGQVRFFLIQWIKMVR